VDIQVNFWAVLVAAIAQFIIGWAWYGPLFGKPWLRMMGKTKEEIMQKGNPAFAMLGSFVPSLIMAYILAHFVVYAGADDLTDAAMLGFWVWLGFVATVMFNSVLFESKPKKLYIINVLYYLVSLIVMAVVLMVWR
jgi:hypothetical protein